VPPKFPLASAKGGLASFRFPNGLVADSNMEIFVSDTADHRIRYASQTEVGAEVQGGIELSCKGSRTSSPPPACHASPRAFFCKLLIGDASQVCDSEENPALV